ncbi:hypothetical protein SDC9_206962 [bioreactor metagenome]|uniref:Uncharacterized protein n=1 Tax=bioreactor metagenome TaxID=1076179 RepID=A0A645J6J7_9ZZZZ
MREIGYESGGIGPGFCWGRYMIIYVKAGVKSKKVAARIYIRDNGIVLRLFLSEIDKHKAFIENAPDFIRLPFVGDYGSCGHCHNEKQGICKFRKTYHLENRLIEKCNGITFEYEKPDIGKLPDYMALLKEFYPVRKGGENI